MRTSLAADARWIALSGLAPVLLTLVLIALGLAAQSRGAEPQYALRIGQPRPVTATLTYELDVPAMDVKQWIFFVAAAPELAGQTKVRTIVDPRGVKVDDLRIRDRKLVVARDGGAGVEHQAKITITYQASLASRDLIHALAATPPAVPDANAMEQSPPAKPSAKPKPAAKPIDLTPNERKLYLASTEWSNHTDATFADLLTANNLRRTADESEIAFARRVFAFAKSHGKYTLKPTEEKTAASVAKNYTTDCCGWSNWFVAVLRASGVPARALVGRWAASAENGDLLNRQQYSQEHVRAEFFVSGIGWIPVDVSQAVQHDGGRENWRYFGHDRGDFLTMHADVDFEVITKETGKLQFHALQLPAWHVIGKGTIKDWTGAHSWRVVDQLVEVADAKGAAPKSKSPTAKGGTTKGAAPAARVPPPPAASATGE
jgi:transglutaminase-like putative cysteine protease